VHDSLNWPAAIFLMSYVLDDLIEPSGLYSVAHL